MPSGSSQDTSRSPPLSQSAARDARHGARAQPDGGLLDGAVLDVNLRGRRVTPLAVALRERSVPFVLVTGYAERQLSEPELRGQPRLDKPLDGENLLRTLAHALQGG